jgi:hypothetical protein
LNGKIITLSTKKLIYEFRDIPPREEDMKSEIRYGKMLRVKPEVDELVKKVADKLGYLPYTVRNVAILIGLQQIALGQKVPDSDAEFLELFERTRRLVENMWVG